VAAKSLRELLMARPEDGRFRLAEIDPSSTPGLKGKKKRRRTDFENDAERLFQLQERLYAEHKRSLLIVLQSMDTGGKDGTVTHVIGHMNPQAVNVTPFKAPTPEEKRHGFLWRIRKHLPQPGFVQIFNRSHYEDVLVARVHNLADPDVIERRYSEINQFEKQLVKSGTQVVKFMLHISYDEQRKRLLDRLLDPDKQWKFNEKDIDERAFWDDYQSAYGIAVSRCSTAWAPWYVVPANDKDYRNWAVAQVLVETFDEMDPQYPHPKLDIKRLEKRLKA
jgi:PPK2 family polyphosphate:nucleotide phosphotransferase